MSIILSMAEGGNDKGDRKTYKFSAFMLLTAVALQTRRRLDALLKVNQSKDKELEAAKNELAALRQKNIAIKTELFDQSIIQRQYHRLIASEFQSEMTQLRETHELCELDLLHQNARLHLFAQRMKDQNERLTAKLQQMFEPEDNRMLMQQPLEAQLKQIRATPDCTYNEHLVSPRITPNVTDDDDAVVDGVYAETNSKNNKNKNSADAVTVNVLSSHVGQDVDTDEMDDEWTSHAQQGQEEDGDVMEWFNFTIST